MKLLYALAFLALSFPVLAQTGPAGVGTTDGTGTLNLWLDAGKVTATNGATVTSWTDGSGKGNDFTAGTGAVYYSSRVNGKPAFNFNGTSHYFQRVYDADLNPTSYTIFTASKVSTSSIFKSLITSRSNTGSGIRGYMLYARPSSANDNWTFWTGDNTATYRELDLATNTVDAWAGQTMRHQSGTDGKQLRVSRQVTVKSTASVAANLTRPTRIGAGTTESSTAEYHFKGDIAEVIIFGTYVNETQRILVKNYLSAKYGYTTSSDNVYLQDDVANGNFDTDVAGIGRISSSDLHTDSRGSGIVRINNPQDLGNSEFLLWGHDNATKGATQTTDLPAGVDHRFVRIWRVSERNATGSSAVDMGAVDLSVDLTGLSGYSGGQVRLLVDTDNDGSFADETPISGASDEGSNVYKFAGVTALADARRFTFATSNSEAPQGPGGVGLVNTTSTLHLWLDAGALGDANNATVTNWSDRSGKGKNFTGGAGATMKHAAVNGRSALSFDGSSQYFEKAFDADLNTSAFTCFSASKVNSSGLYKTIISSRDGTGTPTLGYMLYAAPTSNIWTFWTGQPAGGWAKLDAGSTAGAWGGQVMTHSSGTNGKIFRINTTGASSLTQTAEMPVNTINNTRVGAGFNEGAAQYFFTGDIGEVIYFGEALASSKRILVANFLAAKYGYALSANDVYRQDDAANGNYDYDVAGIGRIGSTDLHNDAQGTGMVRMRNPQGLGDGEFLTWGHDNGAATFTNEADAPAGTSARFPRVWRVSELNSSGTTAVDVGAVDVRWDLSELGSLTASDLSLLVDTDGDGAFSDETPITGATDLGDGVYQFSAVSALQNGRRFTLASATASAAMPVDLLYFHAEATTERTVHLNWETASESHNDFFTLEKSADGKVWSAFHLIHGSSNSAGRLTYEALDAQPNPQTTYYRLKQTDIDGAFTYSPVRQVSLSATSAPIRLYPNPAGETVTLEGEAESLADLRVWSVHGQDVTRRIRIDGEGTARRTLNLSGLPAGGYVVRTATANLIFYRQ
ncbi:T9SS type A sorting domain-containing protein [Lewinella sp. JB7]|uniref:T9SS type A sorting domain-containing protein n=1 Tax=Lewinella sp. JB7 TaxID=2962887 RepID=UPI0020C9BB89|nr:T9SS type A sorting domain-containing protein [Lewinella sp. JB7]MCP9234315.1 T9SS type A sorting domain-containing protein [Lewinella sp. JB7]